jgi:hypothetical protein
MEIDGGKPPAISSTKVTSESIVYHIGLIGGSEEYSHSCSFSIAKANILLWAHYCFHDY